MVSAASVVMVSADVVEEAGECGLEWMDPSMLGRPSEGESSGMLVGRKLNWSVLGVLEDGECNVVGVRGPSGKSGAELGNAVGEDAEPGLGTAS